MRAARLAAQKGLKTAIIEGRHWGGTCVNLGCVPKKYMVFAADYQKDLQLAADYGWHLDKASFHWDELRSHLEAETQRLQSVYRDLLTKAGVEMMDGYARFVSADQVEVEGNLYKAKRIILAMGGRPFMPDLPGKEYALSSDDIFSMPSLPQRIAVFGGGYIALEFASILCGFGVEVILVHRSEKLLRNLDAELSAFVTAETDKRIQLLLNTKISEIRPKNQSYEVLLSSREGDEWKEVDAVLFAVGRIPRTMGLEQAGVALTEKGAVAVDDNYRTSQSHIFAIGDLIAKKALTPVAIAEAAALVGSDFGEKKDCGLNYDSIPTAIFCRPEIATIGATEAQARERGEVEVHKLSFVPMRRMFSRRRPRFFIKLLCEKNHGRLLGIHIAGEGAAEIMQGFAVAYTAGLKKKDLDGTIGIHPTLAEELVSLR